MYPAVIGVIPRADYILRITFDNGESGFLDIKPILEFGVFQKLKDAEAFKRVKVSFDTVEWDCGVDLDPEYVYQKCVATDPALESACAKSPLEAGSAVGETGEKYGR